MGPPAIIHVCAWKINELWTNDVRILRRHWPNDVRHAVVDAVYWNIITRHLGELAQGKTPRVLVVDGSMMKGLNTYSKLLLYRLISHWTSQECQFPCVVVCKEENDITKYIKGRLVVAPGDGLPC